MRKDQRSRALKSGIIALDTGGTLNCTIRDVSQDGARIKLATVMSLPDTFTLIFVTDSKRVRVARRWMKGAEAGVRFLEPAKRYVAPEAT